jgi:20S proteasome alpha/beta subunit
MRIKLARKVRRALYASPTRFEGQRTPEPKRSRRNRLHTGTTILAMQFENGVVMAADRQITGRAIMSDEAVKIERITDDSALLSCGLVSSGQLIEEALAVHCRSFRETTGYELSVRGQVQFACRVSRDAYAWYGWWDWAFGGILVGLEADKSFSMYSIDLDGAREQPKRFTSAGSGFRFARTAMQMRWRPGLTRVDTLRIAMEALYYAGRNDEYTSDLRVTTPSVAMLTTEGLAFLADAEVRAAADAVIATAGRYL